MRSFTFQLVIIVLFGSQAAAQSPSIAPLPIERVEGFGGFFFRAKDPEGLAKWYAEHLGIARTPSDYTQQPWVQSAGATIFEPFPRDAKLFERPEQAFVLNFRVRDLDKMTAQLRRSNIKVEVDPAVYPNGRFALTHDPENNPIQLWQPARSTRRSKQ